MKGTSLIIVDEDYNPNPRDLFSNQEVKLASISKT